MIADSLLRCRRRLWDGHASLAGVRTRADLRHRVPCAPGRPQTLAPCTLECGLKKRAGESGT
eukprot:5871894-Pyramimonas_sp.AAC.1